MADLVVLDAALMRLRRLWTSPRTHDGMRADLGEDVELSTVLVVDALAREPGLQPAACGVAEVAERLDVAPSTASRLVERAVAAGMVRREVSPADARRAELHLTDAGHELHERARRFRAGYLARVLDDWPPQQVASLAAGLDAFAHAVASQAATSSRLATQ
jgi:DNA-binding MarR family transcriptional regulator